jgi:isopenicillin N synthase-like dioxygenase
MAVVLPSNSSQHGFSISNIISRFRSKKRTKPKPIEKQEQEHLSADIRPPLIPSPLPLVLPQHQHILPTLGWTTITFPQPQNATPSNPHPPGPHPLQTAYESLFAASQAFFDLPATTKSQWKHKLGSEEGWSSIPGEKEFITLRSLEYCPDVLREPAKLYWDLMGTYLTSSLSRIATSLALSDPEALTRFVGPCASMQPTDTLKTATMLRLFRYEGWDAKVVAEPHSDLGLLSVVVGNVPGLEVWDGYAWFDVEREVQRAGMQGASLLVGRQLERLSNGRYGAGGHRVVSYGAQKPAQPSEMREEEKRYRFSIVFVLRAHEPVVIESEALETVVTGKWDEPITGMTAGKMYDEIRGRHYNINIGVEEREKQRRNVKMGKVA